MTHPNAELLRTFYDAFSRRDAEAMGRCYADDVRFSDPVFPDLHGDEARGMWKMLCARGKDLTLVASGIEADDRTGKAHWEADYTFSATGRKVHNVIDARFVFRDGLIVEHVDRFDLWAWTRMALGPVGVLLGWSPLVQNKVRGQARDGLKAFLSKV